MKTFLQASVACLTILTMLTAFAGMIVIITYLSIALDTEPADDPNCPSFVRNWNIGFLIWCIWCIFASGSQTKSGDDSSNNLPICVVCVQTLVALGTLCCCMAIPIVIHQHLLGVCPGTAYEEAFEVVFVYYVTCLGLLAGIGCAGCVGCRMATKGDEMLGSTNLMDDEAATSL